ncbi:response regulator [uncultured Alteromonas sp.]|jgi:two-component system OmpR family response regulator/two-component system response regulator RstA|uniref:response regulator n=1 Tax=uncultured Alteromonas sp. TaxID=179113 RepID=UPI0025FC3F58|nr:response regulator [uncultured Alteromonas sp.]
MKSLILVEDDERLAELVGQYLTANGFSVVRFADGEGLTERVKTRAPDAIILDVMLPGDDGFTLCNRLRQFYTGPLLFMTAKSESFDQVLGLEIGADDYVVKPVEPRVLLARVNALMRRAASAEPVANSGSLVTFGKLSIDKLSRRVSLGGEDIALTSHEFDLLCLLADNASQLVERTTLYKALIGREYDGLDRSADVRVSRLRKKLKDNPQNPYRIKTIWGKGFFFVADAWSDE